MWLQGSEQGAEGWELSSGSNYLIVLALQSLGGSLNFYSEWDGEPLEDIEQRN